MYQIKQTFDSNHSVHTRAKLLACCIPKLSVDSIMWAPVTNKERSWCIRWRLGWLPGGGLKSYQNCPNTLFTRKHALYCLPMHRRLKVSSQHDDSLSYTLSQLPKSKPTSPRRIQYLKNIWPIVCKILAELDAYHNPDSNLQQYYDASPGQAFIT